MNSRPCRLASVLAALWLATTLVSTARSGTVSLAPDTTDTGILTAARAQIQAGTSDRALAQLVSAITAREQDGDTRSLRYESLLHIYGEALGKSSARGDSTAHRRARAAVELSRGLHGPRSLEAATSMLNLGRVLLRAQQARAARAEVDSAVAIRRSLLGSDHADLAAALVVAGRAARENDDPDGAERCTDEVFSIRSRSLPADHVDLAAALNNRALARRMRGDFAGAYRDGLAAVAIYERQLPPTHTNRIVALKNLGTSALLVGDAMGGIHAYRKAIDAYEMIVPVDSVAVAQCHDELGLACGSMGDYDRALESHGRARALLEAMARPDSLTLRNTLINRGEMLRARGDLAPARAEFEHGLAIERALGLASSVGLEAIWHDLGLLLQQEGHPDSAVAILTRAIELRRRRAGEDALASILLARALAGHDAGAMELARVDLARASGIAQRTLGRDALLTAQIGMFEAQLAAETGDSSAAFALALTCEARARSCSREILRYVSERQARAYASIRPQALDLVLSLASGPSSDAQRRGAAWDCLIGSRGLVLDAFAARQLDLRATADSTSRALEGRRFAARQRIANLILRQHKGAPDPAAMSALAFASNEAEQADWSLGRRAVQRAEAEAAEPGLAALVDALPPGAALLAYVRWNRSSLFETRRSRAGYGALIARAGSAPTLVDLGPAAPIDSLVRAWRRSLARGATGRERAIGARVRQAIWDPLAASLAGARRLYLVPDGCLNDVSWYALPTAAGRVLDEDLEIHLLTSEKDLLARPIAAGREGPVVVLGGPDFERMAPGDGPRAPDALVASRGAPDGCDAFDRRRFGALPFSAREVRGVSSLARRRPGGGEVLELSGGSASEPAFVALAPRATWIHAATHGFFVDQACRIGRWDVGEGVTAGAALDPFLYSGIALAGANRRAETLDPAVDGILTANEFALMDLSRVRGMVITGCDTGLGDYVTGEGVYGLRRALERAGVRSLTLALWPIDDQTAERWSLAFYDHLWQRGLSPSAAGRAAMRQVRRELRAAGFGDSPRLWGGLVVSGP